MEKNEIVSFERKGNNFYELCFLDNVEKIYTDEEGILSIFNKRNRAYELLPEGCIIVPTSKVSSFEGKLLGGILEDSVRIVFGQVVNGKIKGYSCSVFFIPTSDNLFDLLDYGNIENFDKK